MSGEQAVKARSGNVDEHLADGPALDRLVGGGDIVEREAVGGELAQVAAAHEAVEGGAVGKVLVDIP